MYLQEVKHLVSEIIASGEPYRIADLAITGRELIAIGFKGKEIQEELELLVKIISGNPKCNTREKLLVQAQHDWGELYGEDD